MSNPAALIQIKSKRSRSSNFTVFETECLVKEALKRAAVIESKQTDAVTWKAKEDAWNQVTEAFNAITAGTRNVKHLKSKYECIKSSIKKKCNAEKDEQFKTGSGAGTTILLAPWEEKISQLILLGVEGLPGRSDSNTVEQANNFETESVNSDDTDTHSVNITGTTLMEVENHITTTLQAQNLENEITKKRLTWDSWSPARLRTLKKKKLKTFNTPTMITTHELIDLQKKVAEQELLKLSIEIEYIRKVEKQAEIEHNLRMEILQRQKEALNE